MKILALAVVALLCAAASAHQPAEDECCDICEQVIRQTSDFFQKCGADLTSILVVKMYKDCKMLKENPKKLDTWVKNIQLICKAKNGADVTFGCPEPPTCEPCDLCDELKKDTCFMSLNKILQDCLMKSCKILQGDKAKLDVFFTNLGLICQGKNLEFKTPECPDCEECPDPCPCPTTPPPCPVCDILEQEPCIEQLDDILSATIIKACRRLEAQNIPAQMTAFFENLQLTCDDKGYGFTPPTCEPCVCPPTCKICEDVENSDCFKAIDPIQQALLKTNCAPLTTDAQLAAFANSFKNICTLKGETYEPCKKCECKNDCDPCDVIGNTQCLMDIDDILTTKLVNACKKLMTKDSIDALMKNVELVCGEKEFEFKWECPCDCKECKKPEPCPTSPVVT